MKKRIFYTAVAIGAISELAAIIYSLHTRDEFVCGGELFVLPLFLMAAYCVTEIWDMGQHKLKHSRRLTTRTKSGKAVLDKDTFFEYDEETLINNQNAFEPFGAVVDKLCRYEEMERRS